MHVFLPRILKLLQCLMSLFRLGVIINVNFMLIVIVQHVKHENNDKIDLSIM